MIGQGLAPRAGSSDQVCARGAGAPQARGAAAEWRLRAAVEVATLREHAVDGHERSLIEVAGPGQAAVRVVEHQAVYRCHPCQAALVDHLVDGSEKRESLSAQREGPGPG